jgi:hypothetical protein
MRNIFLKLNNTLVFLSFFSFFFLWSFNFFGFDSFRYLIIYPIILAIIGIHHSYNFKNNIIYHFFFTFIFVHYLIVNYFNNSQFKVFDFLNIIIIFFLFLSYYNYRQFLKKNFKLILYLYSSLLFISSLVIKSKSDIGGCSEYFSNFLDIYSINLSQGFFMERSHLAMMNVGMVISSFYLAILDKDQKLLLLSFFIFFLNVINISTTFIVGYFLCGLIFFILIKKIIFRFIILFTSILLALILLNNFNCSKKISSFNLENITKNNTIVTPKLKIPGQNYTTRIYERSLLVSINTLKKKPWGWGYNGNYKAVNDFIQQFDLNRIASPIINFNLQDSLGNIFKLTTEFGILSLIIFYLFFYYLIKKRMNFDPINIFLLSIFIVQLLRGAGYINGGFILAIYEFLIFYNKNKSS